MRKRSIYKQGRPRSDAAKRRVSSGSALFAKINTLLVIVDYKNYKNCIWFALIGDNHKFCQNWIQRDFLNICSMHTFHMHNIKNPSEL